MFAYTKSRLTRTVATALAASLALSACNKASDQVARTEANAPALPDLPATLPLASGAATPVAYAPEPSELPDTRAIPAVRTVAPDDAYAYADQAYGFMDALGEAPPDYGFNYDGVDPWAWQGYDDSVSFAEPIDGGYRYYYYRPGAETPYFIRDPRYGYGYDNGQLAVVYAADGAIIPYESYGPQLGYASRYWVRGRELWQASRTRRRQPVIAANWVRQRPVIVESRSRWLEARPRQPEWIAYHQRIAPRQDRHWQPEEIRREADVRRYANWQREDFRTPPPPRAIPIGWQQASWAKDPRRFAPAQAAVERFAARSPERARDRGPIGEPNREIARPVDRAPRPEIDRQRREDIQRQIAEGQARRRATMQVVNAPQAQQQARATERQQRQDMRRQNAAENAQRRDQAVARDQRQQVRAEQTAAREQLRQQREQRAGARQERAQQSAARAQQQRQRTQADQARAGREQAQRSEARQAQAQQAQARQAQAQAQRQQQQVERQQARQAERQQQQAARAQVRQAPPQLQARPQPAPRPQGGNPGGGRPDRNPGGGHERGGPPR